MKVIGGGLPRTGTLTQKVALELLGFGPCYHMVDVLADLDTRVPHWNAAIEGHPDWETTFAGFQSTVDWPSSRFYKELNEAYPEAKFILSTRDPDSWVHSMRTTVRALYYGGSGDDLMFHLSAAQAQVRPPWSAFLRTIKGVGWEGSGTFTDHHETPEQMKEIFQLHNEEVKATIPPERLLVWSVTEGWERLCEFLEVPVPDVPFPHVNDSKTFVDRIKAGSMAALDAWWEKERPAAA